MSDLGHIVNKTKYIFRTDVIIFGTNIDKLERNGILILGTIKLGETTVIMGANSKIWVAKPGFQI